MLLFLAVEMLMAVLDGTHEILARHHAGHSQASAYFFQGQALTSVHHEYRVRARGMVLERPAKNFHSLLDVGLFRRVCSSYGLEGVDHFERIHGLRCSSAAQGVLVKDVAGNCV